MRVLRLLHWKHYLKYGIIASVCYCCAVSVFCRDATFTETWLLFAGNLAYLIVIALSLFSFNKKRKSDASTVSMLAAGHMTTITGILLSCLFCFIILLVYVPGLLQRSIPGKLLIDEPATMVHGKTNGMFFMIYMSIIIGNFVSGLAASIIVSFTLKRNQTGEAMQPRKSEL
jgi:hypothetical protein